MQAFRLIGLVSMLGLVTATSQTTAQGPPTQERLAQMQAQSRSGSYQPVSPVALASWVTAKGSDGKVLDLAVVWRGSPAWFFAAGERSSSGGGTSNSYSASQRFGNVEVYFTLKDSPRIVTIGETAINLGDNNVVLVDGVDAPGGSKVIKSLKIDPSFLHPREIQAVLGRSPEIVAFLRCDLKLDNVAQQKTIDIFCARLADGR
jgi:hypothetical protein